MPTYDYRCTSCAHEFTAIHKISEPAPECPTCHGAVQKMLSAPALHGSTNTRTESAPVRCGMGGCCPHAH